MNVGSSQIKPATCFCEQGLTGTQPRSFIYYYLRPSAEQAWQRPCGLKNLHIYYLALYRKGLQTLAPEQWGLKKIPYPSPTNKKTFLAFLKI